MEVWFLCWLELQLKTQCLLFGESQFHFHLHVKILRNHGCEGAYGNYWVLLLLQQQAVDIHSHTELNLVIWSRHYQRQTVLVMASGIFLLAATFWIYCIGTIINQYIDLQPQLYWLLLFWYLSCRQYLFYACWAQFYFLIIKENIKHSKIYR